jgi:hypothetical protein
MFRVLKDKKMKKNQLITNILFLLFVLLQVNIHTMSNKQKWWGAGMMVLLSFNLFTYTYFDSEIYQDAKKMPLKGKISKFKALVDQQKQEANNQFKYVAKLCVEPFRPGHRAWFLANMIIPVGTWYFANHNN